MRRNIGLASNPARFALCLAGAMSALLLGACGGASTEQPASEPTAAAPPTVSTTEPTAPATTAPAEENEIAALVPDDVKARGYITLAQQTDYPPIVSAADDGRTLIGADPDIIKAIEPLLGVEIRASTIKYPSFIPSLEAGNVDALGTVITDNPERREVGDFIDFVLQGNALVTTADKDLSVSSTDEFCGLRLAVIQGAIGVILLEEQDEACREAGDDPIQIDVFPSIADCLGATTTDRVDGTYLPSLSAAYTVETSEGQLALAGSNLGKLDYAGWMVSKDDPMGEALEAAFQKIYETGQLDEIYSTYGLGDLITEPGLNLAPLD